MAAELVREAKKEARHSINSAKVVKIMKVKSKLAAKYYAKILIRGFQGEN